MNISEFKAWLSGFEEAFDGAPTPEQWAKIKAKLAQTEALKFDNPIIPAFPQPSTDPYRYTIATCTVDEDIRMGSPQ